METIYDTELSDENIVNYLVRLKARVFKIIPHRQEYIPIDKYLERLIKELLSLDSLLKHDIGVELTCELNVILTLGTFKETKEQVFLCLDIIEKMIKLLERGDSI